MKQQQPQVVHSIQKVADTNDSDIIFDSPNSEYTYSLLVLVATLFSQHGREEIDHYTVLARKFRTQRCDGLD